jgi:dihydroorotate dehydrogenase electron transfer subunit
MVTRQTATFRYARPDPPFWRVRFDVEHPPSPGGFVLADLEPPLRTPLFPSAIDASGFVTCLEPGHPATKLLPGAEVDVLGPLGRGFRVSDRTTRLLLAADITNWPVVRPLFTAAPSVVLILEAETRGQLPAPARFPPSLELVLVTRDGSAGYAGWVGDGESDNDTDSDPSTPWASRIRTLVGWADAICVAFERARYPAVGRLIRDVRLQPRSGFAQAWVRVPMPCGVGACEVCRVRTRHGEKQACTDGPVFDLLELR